MKKMKMSIVRWLGIQDRILQLELEISDLESKVVLLESELQETQSEIEDKITSYDAENIAEDAFANIDMYDHEYTISNIIQEWMISNKDEHIQESIDKHLENLADSDTIRELISEEVSNHPQLSEDRDDDSSNATWDMNEIIQEVIEEVITRLRG